MDFCEKQSVRDLHGAVKSIPAVLTPALHGGDLFYAPAALTSILIGQGIG